MTTETNKFTIIFIIYNLHWKIHEVSQVLKYEKKVTNDFTTHKLKKSDRYVKI